MWKRTREVRCGLGFSRAAERIVVNAGLWIKAQSSMSAKHEQADFVDRITSILGRFGAFWLDRPYYQQVVLVLVVLVAKNAFDIELRNIQEAYLPGVQEFPTAVGYFSGSYGQVVIAAVLGITTTTQWVILHVILIAVALTTGFWLVGRRDAHSRSFLILALAAATATSSLFVSIGKYDVITYLGSVILALSRSLPAATLGALVMASGNPEQSILASVALLVLSFAGEFRDLRRRAAAAIVATTLTWLMVQVWFIVSDMGVGRLQLLPEYFAESITVVIANPADSAWGWLGAGWLFVLVGIIAISARSRKWVVASLVAVPALAAAVTADGPRVFGAVSLPVYLGLATYVGMNVRPQQQRTRVLVGSLALLSLLLPTGRGYGDWLYGQLLQLVSTWF